MKEFTSANGIHMIEGTFFNWEKLTPTGERKNEHHFHVSFGRGFDIKSAIFIQEDNVLRLDHAVRFYCEELIQAEMLLLLLIKGMNEQIMPLYIKKDLPDNNEIINSV